MTSRDFCYWLQGYFELAEPNSILAEDLVTVRRHLDMVFKHEIDPACGEQAALAALIAVHGGSGQKVPPNHDKDLARCPATTREYRE